MTQMPPSEETNSCYNKHQEHHPAAGPRKEQGFVMIYRSGILVTTFEPFGGEKLNPTEMVLGKLPDSVRGHAIRKLLLPVEYVKAREFAIAEYDRLLPAAVIMLGQAGGRNAINLETTAKNVMNGSNPDNAGFRPDHTPVVAGGANTLRSTLPIDKMIRAVEALGIPCVESGCAGEYVCNALFYGMLHHNKGSVPTGFIHVPYVREQGHEESPFMELETIYLGILAALEAVATEVV